MTLMNALELISFRLYCCHRPDILALLINVYLCAWVCGGWGGVGGGGMGGLCGVFWLVNGVSTEWHEQ